MPQLISAYIIITITQLSLRDLASALQGRTLRDLDQGL
jgi:hypothetical protein